MTSPSTTALSFERLVTAIGHTHAEMVAQAARAVNASLTLRNWLIGFHIAEYEQQGTDRAQYGEKLLDRLSERLVQAGIGRAEARELRRYRQFYLTYPQIRESLSPELLEPLLPPADADRIRESLTMPRGRPETLPPPEPAVARRRASMSPQVPFVHKLG